MPRRSANVTRVRFTPARASNGLLGYVTCRVGPLHLDGLAPRRCRSGRLALSLPCWRDARGRRHPFVRPGGPGLERAILEALGAEGVEP